MPEANSGNVFMCRRYSDSSSYCVSTSIGYTFCVEGWSVVGKSFWSILHKMRCYLKWISCLRLSVSGMHPIFSLKPLTCNKQEDYLHSANYRNLSSESKNVKPRLRTK